MLSRCECFLIFLPPLSYNDALDSTMKPLAPSPIAYLPASPAHGILTKTSLLPHLLPQPAVRKVLVPPANARLLHTRKPSRVIGIRARANTPPGYWNIGFPDTQEVGDINEKAEAMHRKKREEVEREVGSGGGKYRGR